MLGLDEGRMPNFCLRPRKASHISRSLSDVLDTLNSDTCFSWGCTCNSAGKHLDDSRCLVMTLPMLINALTYVDWRECTTKKEGCS